MSHTHSQARRHSFVLGLWLQPGSRQGEQSAWRISLEDPNTTERSGFKTLAELDAFLQAWMDEEEAGEGGVYGEMRERP